jgi:hypothetical protein
VCAIFLSHRGILSGGSPRGKTSGGAVNRGRGDRTRAGLFRVHKEPHHPAMEMLRPLLEVVLSLVREAFLIVVRRLVEEFAERDKRKRDSVRRTRG